MDTPVPTPEFSRPVRGERIGREPKSRHLEANAAERGKLAERLGLLALSRLVADVEFRRRGGGRIELRGSFEADLVQSCVVTLAPVPASVAESFEMSFIEVDPGAEPEERETTISLEGAEPPEPVAGGAIDLGEAVAQQLAVAIDPYPRAPEATPGWSDDPAGEGEARPHPFADLAKLRKTGENP
jgi:uncharacterized metal-binding protein YceD (DUF177 family)